jgi:hypothetical protein
MTRIFWTLSLCALSLTWLVGAADSEERSETAKLSAKKEGTEVIVKVDDAEFTRYKFADSQKYPYFWPVRGPRSRESVTTESSEPYPHHHSLFFGCDRVNGGNYWQDTLERGRIDSEEVKVVEADGKRVVIEDRCVWKRPGNPDVFKDVRRWTLSAPTADSRWIELEITLTALVDIRVERTNHSLFSARVVEELSPKGGGALVNSAGDEGEKATWGKKAEWCGFHGTRDGITEGLTILVHPKNRWSPCRWFTRDYGFVSPTPMYWLEGGAWTLEKGESVRLRYLVVVHEGSSQEADIAKIYEAWSRA